MAEIRRNGPQCHYLDYGVAFFKYLHVTCLVCTQLLK